MWIIQTQHHVDRSATKRAATSFLFYPCHTRSTEALMAARDKFRDKCMSCVALLDEADFFFSSLLYVETVEASTSTPATLHISRHSSRDAIGPRWLINQSRAGVF